MVKAGIELIVGKLANITLQSTLLEMISMAQDRDSKLVEQWEKVVVRLIKDSTVYEMVQRTGEVL